MFKYLFKYLKLKRENERLSQELDKQRKLTTALFAEISRRDQKISTLIQHNEIRNPDPFNFEFPGTEKYFDDFWNKLQKL